MDDAELVVSELLAVLETVDDAVDEVIDTELEVELAVAEALWEFVAEAVLEAVLTGTSREEMAVEDALALDILAEIGNDEGIHLARVVDADARKDIETTDLTRIVQRVSRDIIDPN